MATSLPLTNARIPGARTLAEMQDYVLGITSTTADSDSLKSVRQFINHGIDRVINSRRWRRITGFQDVVMVTGQATYNLDGNYRDPINCIRLNSSDQPDGRVFYKQFQTFDQDHPVATSSGDPTIYTVFYDEHQMILDVPPQNSWVVDYPVIRLKFFRRVAHVTKPGDTINAPSEFESAIMDYARMKWVLSQSPDLWSEARSEFGDQLAQLTYDDNTLNTDYGED